jgi:YidC/Oxa1 family membrane protein insertase
MIIANIIESAFGPLIDVFKQVLITVHNVVGGSWGWSIIGLTIVIRIITLPIMLKQFRSMAKMLVHQPELKKLQARYKDDKQRLNEEMMKYYKENGVNPLASCLPMLVQLPVFISLFYMLRTDLKHQICGPAIRAAGLTTAQLTNRGCSSLKPHSGAFLFIHDITAKATGVPLIVLIALYMVSMFLTSFLSTATMERNQRIMMLGLPLIFTFIIYRYPSGLLLYWITTNLTQIPLQYFVRRRVGTPPPVVATATAGSGGNGRAVPRLARAAVASTAERAAPAERSGAPRQPPRKRKKRSGRRR